MEEKIYYFTFGVGQQHAGKYVKVYAYNAQDARDAMKRHYGLDWAFMYREGRIDLSGKECLTVLNALHRITVGDMLELTKRFNQIVGGAQCLKIKRLEQLIRDIEDLGINDTYLMQLVGTIFEEIHLTKKLQGVV